MEHPDDITLTQLAFPRESIEIDPKWKLHALECPECMDAILMLREMAEQGVFDKPSCELKNCARSYSEEGYSESTYAKSAAAIMIGGVAVDQCEELSLDMDISRSAISDVAAGGIVSDVPGKGIEPTDTNMEHSEADAVTDLENPDAEYVPGESDGNEIAEELLNRLSDILDSFL